MTQWIDFSADPMTVFNEWYEASLKENTFEPTKMTLATLGEDGFPAARVVLLKQLDEKGFGFFTNYVSRKAQELDQLRKAAVVFHWEKPLHRQVRIQGTVEKMSHEESSQYFKTRRRGSQIGAWASPQSSVIEDREVLIEKVAALEERFRGKEVPCPEFWGGYRLKPLKMEFWQAGEFRLHDRACFTRSSLESAWTCRRLAP